MLKIKLLLASIFLCFLVSAQQTYTPKKVYALAPITVKKPVLIDSVSVKNTKFSDETLLSYNVAFPSLTSFNKEITVDSDGFFRLEKPQSGYALQLIAFNISSSQYGKGKLKITSPNRLQVYLDNESKATKTQMNDSLQAAGSAEYTWESVNNNVSVVVKMLVSATDKLAPALKIELTPDKTYKDLVYTFNNENKRLITIQDILEGKRLSSSEISPSGRFVLLRLNEVVSGGERKNFIEIYDNQSKKTIFSETANRSQLRWMPKSDKLYYVAESINGNTMYTFDPLTNETRILAERLPKEYFSIAPDEKSMFYSVKESQDIKNPKGLKRLMSPEDRQGGFRDRYYIYRYFFDFFKWYFFKLFFNKIKTDLFGFFACIVNKIFS